MTLRDRPYEAFFGFATLLFLAATLGSDVVARTTVGGEGLGKAISEHAYYALVQPIGTILLIAPFLLLGWMSASLAKRKGFNGGLGVFFLGAFLLGVMYFIWISRLSELHETENVDRRNPFCRSPPFQEHPTFTDLSRLPMVGYA